MKTKLLLAAGLLLALALFLPAARATPISAFLLNTNNQHWYVLLSQATWTASEAEAVSLGGHLASVNDATEQNWIYNKFSSFGGSSRLLWIGMSDVAAEGTYTWSNGDPVTYYNWASGEPTGNSVENYVSMYYPGHSQQSKWNDWGYVLADPVNLPMHGVVEFGSNAFVSLVQAGSVWKYLDNGTDQGTAWKETNFTDSAWASGPAQLGYGDGDEATVVSYGPNSASKNITTYFRRSFQVTNLVTFTNLAVRLLRDDGAVVYLNGVEVFRSNLPDGAIGYQTLAVNAVSGTDESTFFTAPIPLGLLRAGTNVVAVEIHQADVTSSDSSFDLELLGNTGLFNSFNNLPAPWINLDIGGPGVRGAASVQTNGPLWLVQGGGGDIQNTSDQFHYVYAAVAGDWDIQARVVSIPQVDPWAKAGVMMRETLLAGAKNVGMLMTPEHGAPFQWRSTASGGTSASAGVTALPSWVRLVRSGNMFSGYTSTNGLNWVLVNSISVAMSNQIYAGLAVCAHNNSKACMAAFDSVSGLSATWSQQDIGSPGVAGSAFIETNAPTFLVQGGGADIYDLADHFHFVAQSVTKDFAFQARVAAQGNSSEWAKAGVMMRESFQPGSRHIFMGMTPAHGAQSVMRSGTDGSSTNFVRAGPVTPYWVRLVRAGSQFTAFASTNALDWTQVNSATLNMKDTIYAGLTVLSHDNTANCEAAFDSVDFLPVVNAVNAVDGDLFNVGDPIELDADASDRDGQVVQVKYYYQDTNFIGAASVPPYAYIWTNAPPGMNYVSARAIDDKGVEGPPLTHAVFVAEPDTHVTFFPEFLSSSGLILQGDATVTNKSLRVSKGQQSALGGAWLGQRIHVASGFETTFQFQLTTVNYYGDGFALVLFDAPQPYLGGSGAGIGYAGLPKSLAVEFDGYWNPDNGDPNGLHIGVHTRGTLANTDNESAALARANNPPNFLDGKIHTAKITSFNDVLAVFLDDLTTPIISVNVSLSNTLNLTEGAAWVGFTGSSGNYYENHDILNWSFVTTNLHPVISLTAPTNGAIFLPTDSFVLNAAATDLDGTIQQVVFFVDGNYAGSATQSPWQLPVGALPAGPHVLSAAALDDTGAATVSAPVTIIVNTPPVARCRDVTVPADATCTALANIDAGSYDVDFQDEILLTQTPPPPYPLGSTVVTLTATDTYGASNSCAATVTVVDTTPPTITCTSDITISTATGICFSNVIFTVTGSDLCGAVNVLCVPPSGSAFAVGATLVNCTATDTAGNSNVCAFTVTVNDTEPPQLICPTSLFHNAVAADVRRLKKDQSLVTSAATTTKEPPPDFVLPADAGQCSKSNVTWTASATDNCAVTNVICVPPSGSTFAVGTNLVTCTATDASGNTASCNFTVTILDTEPPAIICPANLVLNPPAEAAAFLPPPTTITFTVTAIDNCDTHASFVCTPPSGSAFSIGTTSIQCMATDDAGNTNACTFTIRLNARPLVSLITPSNGSTFVTPQPISLLADASDPDGDGVAQVDFFAGTNLLGSAISGYVFIWTNAPVGPHSLTARATDGAGAEATSSAVQITVLAQPPTSYAPVTSSNLNRQTSLYVQPVRITNPTAGTFDALRLWIALDTNSLAHNVRVWNATGTSNGIPFVLYNQPLPPGQSVDLSVEYYIPDRRTMPNPGFTVELISASAPPDPAGTVLEVDRALRLADGTFWVEFSTLSNRVYYLQYSGDVAAWKTALPAVLGTGHRVSWRDAGPPKTESAPQSVTNRFYRVILLH